MQLDPPKEQSLNFAWPQCINPLNWMILEISMCSGDPKTGNVQFSNGRPCPDFKWCSDFEWLSITIRKPDNLTIPYLPVT